MKYRNLLVAHEVYRQQKQMYDARKHSVPDRIVSVSQPHVRSIVRGKANAPVESGAKISVSKVGRFAFLDRFSWDAYNESTDLKPGIEYYPESVHVDAIVLLVMNLETLLQILLRLFAQLWRSAVLICESPFAERQIDFKSVA